MRAAIVLFSLAASVQAQTPPCDANCEEARKEFKAGREVWKGLDRSVRSARRTAGMLSYAPGPLPASSLKNNLIASYDSSADDGIARLRHAIELDPEFSDAMTYLNLLIRARADLRNSAEQYARDSEEADAWISRSFQARQNEKPPPTQSGPFMVPGDFEPAILIRKIDPTCPTEKGLNLNGVLRLTVSVGKGGEVDFVQVVNGSPLLIPAALDAVKRWLYRPSTAGDQLLAVILPVDIEMHC